MHSRQSDDIDDATRRIVTGHYSSRRCVIKSTRDIMLKSPWATRTSAQIRIGASANSSGKKKLDTILVDRMESESSEGH